MAAEITRFGIVDYLVFVLILLLSAAIGVYYAVSGGRQRTAQEFLLGNRNMGALPVAFSLLASFTSAVALLGIPAEVYTYGTQYASMCFGYILVMPVAAYFYLPVFYNLGVTSAYEYLERRFNVGIRKCAAVIFIVKMVLYLAVVTYAPALALSQVTGIDPWISVGLILTVCTLYTTIGGIKAVMWTDVLQTILMLTVMVVILVKSVINLGGVEEVWNANQQGKRIEFFNTDFDPRVRHTIWSQSIGALFTWLAIYGVNQAQVQRYLSTPTIRTAQKALWWNLPGTIWNTIVCAAVGLAIYAHYKNCDPLLSHQVHKADQLVPLFAMETLDFLPGLPGLFVAGLFSGSLRFLLHQYPFFRPEFLGCGHVGGFYSGNVQDRHF